MLNLEVAPQLESLDKDTLTSLKLVNDYILDYNINMYKTINNLVISNDEKLISLLEPIFEIIPEDHLKNIFNPVETKKHIDLSTTIKLQNRILNLLIQERHKRDIDCLNSKLDKKINLIKLNDPLVYEIKSPYYLTFSKDDDLNNKFVKFAMLQSIEYDFENKIDSNSDYQSDDDLMNHFIDGITDIEIDDNIVNKDIARLIIPLAASVILNDPNDVDD